MHALVRAHCILSGPGLEDAADPPHGARRLCVLRLEMEDLLVILHGALQVIKLLSRLKYEPSRVHRFSRSKRARSTCARRNSAFTIPGCSSTARSQSSSALAKSSFFRWHIAAHQTCFVRCGLLVKTWAHRE